MFAKTSFLRSRGGPERRWRGGGAGLPLRGRRRLRTPLLPHTIAFQCLAWPTLAPMMKIRARRNVRALIRALALALILPARSVGQFQILSPRPRELFVRLPVPVMIFVGDGEVASDSDIRIVLHVNGVKVLHSISPRPHLFLQCALGPAPNLGNNPSFSQVLESPPSLLVETSLNDVEEGTNALELSVLKNEEVLQKGGDMFSFNFSVNHLSVPREAGLKHRNWVLC